MLPTSDPQTLAPQMDPRKMAELLRLKVAGDPFPFSFIHEADPYSAAPEDLVDGREHAPGTDPGKGVAWYFCWSAECHGSAGGGSSSKRKRKVAAAGETYWHPETGKQAMIGTDGESMGAYKRTLSYVRKIRNSPAIATATPFTRKRLGWCMVEIGLDGELQVVLCKLYRPHPRPPTPAPAPLVPVAETPSRVAIVKNGSAAAALTVVIDLCGSSMPLVQRLKDMAKLVRRVESPEIVLSVMGNTTTATILLAAWKALRCRAEKVGGIHEFLFIKELHLRMCDELGLERSIASGSLDELEHQLQHVAMTKELTPWTRDYLVSFCESMSTKIFYKFLNKHEATLQVWKLRAIATSGRGSSDLTGTTIDSTLESREIQVWKDVDGIFSCDPKVCTDATLVPHLTFDEAAELSDFTEQSMKQAMEYGISVRVRNPSKPQAPGTVITKTRDMSESTLTSIVLKSNIIMLDIKSKRMQGQSDFVITAFSKFQHFEYLGISVHCVRATGGEMSFILVPSELLSQELIKRELKNVVKELKKIAEVHRLADRSVISLIGNAHKSSSILEKALNVLQSINAEVNKLSHESSKVMKAFLIVEKSREKDCLEALHSAFFVKNREPPAPPCGGVTYSSILESLEEALLSDDYPKPVADDDIEDQNDLPTNYDMMLDSAGGRECGEAADELNVEDYGSPVQRYEPSPGACQMCRADRPVDSMDEDQVYGASAQRKNSIRRLVQKSKTWPRLPFCGCPRRARSEIPAPWTIVGIDEPPPSWDPVSTPNFAMYPKVSPRYNLIQKATLGVKKNSPKNRKKVSPKASKSRAQWNLGLEKSLVEILHEHNNEYYRGQNGWSSDTWNHMTKLFRAKNTHVNFTKSQIQDKEKELKKEYRMLKDARMQSGARWCEETCKIQADDHLWDNLVISFPKIGKFKKNGFPLFDSLGELYDGQIAEGIYNFTCTSEDARTVEEVPSGSENDDLQFLHEVCPTQVRDEASSVNEDAVHVGETVDNMKHNEKKVANGPKKKPQQELKKANKSDEMVRVVDRYVKMKEKQADDEKAESNAYSIGKCISALQKMREKFSPEQRVKASKIFKNAENQETFLSWVAEDEQLAVTWLHEELLELP